MSRTISSLTDIETYVANEQPDFTGNDATALVNAIQEASHPDYGRDWSEWLSENIDTLRDEAAHS